MPQRSICTFESIREELSKEVDIQRKNNVKKQYMVFHMSKDMVTGEKINRRSWIHELSIEKGADRLLFFASREKWVYIYCINNVMSRRMVGNHITISPIRSNGKSDIHITAYNTKQQDSNKDPILEPANMHHVFKEFPRNEKNQETFIRYIKKWAPNCFERLEIYCDEYLKKELRGGKQKGGSKCKKMKAGSASTLVELNNIVDTVKDKEINIDMEFNFKNPGASIIEDASSEKEVERIINSFPGDNPVTAIWDTKTKKVRIILNAQNIPEFEKGWRN